MRFPTRSLVLTAVLSCATGMFAQQPEVVHTQLTTQAADHGLNTALDTLKRESAPLWVGYSVPVVDRFSSGWNSNRVARLEGDRSPDNSDDVVAKHATFDHALILLRLSGGILEKIRIESPERQLDAGGLRLVWLTGVGEDDSIRTLTAIARQDAIRRLMDSAVFAISIHQAAAATQALVSLAGADSDLALREKAAFWLANQRGHEGFVAIQRFAREDGDAKFREKLAFDLTLSKEPAALTELIRMAHEDAAAQVRKQAQFWMATKGGKVVAGDLRNAAENDPDTQVRKSAVFALSRLPREEAAVQLIRVADSSKDPAVRKQAVFWLGQSDDPRALDYLTKLLKQ